MKSLNLVKSASAYTFMEIMTVVMVIAMVTSITLPAIDNMFSGLRVSFMAQILVQDIRLARYKSLKEQSPYRLIFDDDWLHYKVQAFRRDDESDSVTEDNTQTEDYDSDQWQTVLDDDEQEIDSSVELVRDSSSPFPKCIFFWPDGTVVTRINSGVNLTDSNIFPLGENFIIFTYGSSAIRINIGAFGVMSSEAYAVPEDDVFGDEDDEIY